MYPLQRTTTLVTHCGSQLYGDVLAEASFRVPSAWPTLVGTPPRLCSCARLHGREVAALEVAAAL